MKQNVQQRVNIHDRYQIEIKVEYQLLPSRKTHYTITNYLFIPQTLGINSTTYPTYEFYRRIQNYIRLRVPEFLLQALLTDSASPLCIIEAILEENKWATSVTQKQRLTDQFKFLRAIMRRSLSEALVQQQRQARRRMPVAPLEIERQLQEHLAFVNTIVERYRKCGQSFVLSQVDTDLYETFTLTDEALSLVVEENLLRVLRFIEKNTPAAWQEKLKAPIVAYIRAEIKYRRQHEYESILSSSGKNEAYLYRVSALKKYTSSVLYLGTAVSREGVTAEHLLFSVAAGISMIFATMLAFFVQMYYGNLTFPVFIALVVGYMFKDRIKEVGRAISLRFLQQRYFDRRIDIHTLPEARKLGKMREKTFFCKASDVPEYIRQARNQGAVSMIDNGAQGEQVLCYTRNVTLFSQMFQKLYKDGPPITGVADILRLDVRPFLHKMDNPFAQRLMLEGNELHTVKCAKVYFINIISVYSDGGIHNQVVSQRVRVTLNRKGLVRLETL